LKYVYASYHGGYVELSVVLQLELAICIPLLILIQFDYFTKATRNWNL